MDWTEWTVLGIFGGVAGAMIAFFIAYIALCIVGLVLSFKYNVKLGLIVLAVNILLAGGLYFLIGLLRIFRVNVMKQLSESDWVRTNLPN